MEINCACAFVYSERGSEKLHSNKMCEQIISIKPLYSNMITLERHLVDIVADTTSCMTADTAVIEIVGIICKWKRMIINS